MHFEEIAGELQFVLDANETLENQEFIIRMSHYKLVQHGASIFIYNRHNNELLSHYNSFDNTQLVCSPDGFPLANEFGAKRFLALKARTALSKAQATEVKPENFSRDRSFPLLAKADTSAPFDVVTLEKLLEINQKNKDKVYDDLASLFDRCADFMPEKQTEYLSGGRRQDKFCRFNIENHQVRNGIVTDQVFLLDKANKIIGTISATVCVTPEGIVDVYFYDEVVDYFTQIDPASEVMRKLQALYDDLILSKDEKNSELAKIIEPIRLTLMAPLFTAARQQIRRTILSLLPSLSEGELDNKIGNGSVRAFIRAADKRVASYEQLGCGTENAGYFVIHGRPTAAAKLVDTYVKEIWGQKKLQELRNPMQANAIDLVGVNTYIEVNADGRVSLALDVASTGASEVMNELEVTNFVNLEHLPEQPRARHAIYGGLLAQLDRENGKHYIAIDPAYSAELVSYVNKPDYTDTLVKKANLLFAKLDQAGEFKELSDDYRIDVLKNIESKRDLERCAVLAKFQKDRLIAMRPSLPDAAALKKMDERYSEEALIKKAQSGKIIVFSAMRGKDIAATMVVNLHATEEKSTLDKTVYISDLIIGKDFIADEQFVMRFMGSTIKALSKELPAVKTLTLMAPGDARDPLVSCIGRARDVGLLATLDKSKQVELGLVPYFVQEPQNKPKQNFTNTPANMFHYKPSVSDGAMVTLQAAPTLSTRL
jgi:hypothetical protein